VIQFSDFVKTYDVRGLVGSQLTPAIVESFGAAFVDVLELEGKHLVIGHDMRDSSDEFAAAFALGAAKRGGNPLMLGLCSTDMTYFASGKLDVASVMFTASHNPASYNGMKFSRAGALGIGLDSGLAEIRDVAQSYFDGGIPVVANLGESKAVNLTRDYVEYLRSLVDLSESKRLKIVVDAANGMGGFTVPLVLGGEAGLPELNLEIVPLYFELDGTFPNHEANPLQVENLRDLQKAVVEHGADLGLAFDGDADRCFAVDEKGGLVSPSALAAIVSLREIERVKAQGEKDITVLHNLLTSKIVEEKIAQAGAKPVRTKVGHSLIKEQMAATKAVFGGEHSAHYYFRDFWGADNGMLAAMHLISELGNSHVSTSELARANTPYFSSGEINSRVDDKQAALERVRNALDFNSEEKFDGTTFHGESDGGWWWCNIRPSNTEPLLRLNVESNHEALMIEIRDKAIKQIRNN
jgi:phosphomannomutase